MNGKLIMNPIMSRKLLLGNTVIDLKPKKENYRETIFIFEATDKLVKDINMLSK